MNKISIVSTGLGNKNLLTAEGLKAIENSDTIIGAEKLIKEFGDGKETIVLKGNLDYIGDFIKENYEKRSIAVLVTGDAGLYSLAQSIKKRLDEDIPCEIIPGVGSLQYLCGKAGIGYENLKIVSLHGKKGSILPYVSYNKTLFVITGGEIKAHDVIKELCDNGLGDVRICAGENMSHEDERILKGNAKELLGCEFKDLTSLIIENDNYVDSYTPLLDSDFVRSKVPMTKEETRWITVSKMNIHPQDVIYDIGAGTGSVTIEMARKANEGMVYGIERNPEGVSLINDNKAKLGAFNVKVIEGLAPECLSHLPKPDKVFIGGSCGNMREIIEAVLEKNPQVKVVINTVTLESLNDSLSALKDLNFNMDIINMNVSRAYSLGGYNLMKANNPIYIISGEKNYED